MDDAFCPWRWVEYSISASIMAMSIAIAIGIREQNTLASIFMLHHTAMFLGLLTEYISVPKGLVDTKNYKFPVGALQLRKWHNLDPSHGLTDYRRDPRALKLISQTEWERERPVYDIQDAKKVLGPESEYFISAQRRNNFVRRMLPHVLGW